MTARPSRLSLSAARGLARRLAAFCWWSLRVHVAERHFLPRPERPDL